MNSKERPAVAPAVDAANRPQHHMYECPYTDYDYELDEGEFGTGNNWVTGRQAALVAQAMMVHVEEAHV